MHNNTHPSTNPPSWYLPGCLDTPACPEWIDCYCKHLRPALETRRVEARYRGVLVGPIEVSGACSPIEGEVT